MEGNGLLLLIIGIGGRGEVPLDLSEGFGEIVPGPHKRPLGGKAIDETVELVVVVDSPLVECIDEGAPVHLDGDPSLVFEHDERLAYGDPAHAEVFGDGVLWYTHTRPQDTVEDQFSDVERNVLGAAGAD
jgi:hypothetical protein